MDFREIKKEAWEISNKNKWNIWKPSLIIALISGIAGAIITAIFGEKSIVGLILNVIVGIALIPATVGLIKYMLNLVRGKKYSIDNLKEFYSIAGICIALSLIIVVFVAVGFLLLIIPGIIIALNYAFVFYLLADNNKLEIKECMSKSKELIKGYRLDYCLFSLSFIGWILLCVLIVPIIWVVPYIITAETLYYDKLKEKRRID